MGLEQRKLGKACVGTFLNLPNELDKLRRCILLETRHHCTEYSAMYESPPQFCSVRPTKESILLRRAHSRSLQSTLAAWSPFLPRGSPETAFWEMAALRAGPTERSRYPAISVVISPAGTAPESA